METLHDCFAVRHKRVFCLLGYSVRSLDWGILGFYHLDSSVPKVWNCPIDVNKLPPFHYLGLNVYTDTKAFISAYAPSEVMRRDIRKLSLTTACGQTGPISWL